MNSTKWIIVAVLVGCALAQTNPQQPGGTPAPQGQLFFVEIDHVKPGAVQQYESNLKQIFSQIGPTLQKSTTYPSFTTWAGDDFRYVSLTPIKDLTDLDRVLKEQQALVQTLGKSTTDQWDAMMMPTIVFTQRSFLRMMPEWSYSPSGSEMTPETTPVCLVEDWYLFADAAAKVDQFAKAYKSMVAQKKVPHGYVVYRGGVGMEQPMVTVVSCAKSRAELAANDETDMKAAGKETEDMAVKQFLPMVRRVQRAYFRYRPEFSIKTAMPAQTAVPERK